MLPAVFRGGRGRPGGGFVIDLAFLVVGIPQRESGEGTGKRVFHAGIQITVHQIGGKTDFRPRKELLVDVEP